MENILRDLHTLAKKHKIDIIGQDFIYINGEAQGEVIITESEEESK